MESVFKRCLSEPINTNSLKPRQSMKCDERTALMAKTDYSEQKMSKNPIDKTILNQTIKITQAIEGYKEASKQTVQKAKILRERYGIKVSAKR